MNGDAPRETIGGRATGMIGLGLLGSAIVDRLRASGWSVVGRDRDGARAEALGIESAESPRALASSLEVVVLCLPDSEVVESVVCAEDGLLSAFGAGDVTSAAPLRLVIDCTTGDPARNIAVAEKLAERGVAYVEASVSASSAMVRRGEGVLLVGAQPDAVELSREILETLAPIVYVLGPPGSGARMKLISNLVLGLNRLAIAEGVALAESCGFDTSTFLEVIRAGPAHSRALETKGEMIRSRDYSRPHARLAQHLKDVRLMLALGEEFGAELPLTTLHRELLERGVQLGLGDSDNSAVAEVLRSLRAQ